jgi:hypothetical protein
MGKFKVWSCVEVKSETPAGRQCEGNRVPSYVFSFLKETVFELLESSQVYTKVYGNSYLNSVCIWE